MTILDFMEDNKPKTTRKKKVVKYEDFPMEHFTCTICNKRFFDTNLYFYDTPSTKCLWCIRRPVRDKKIIK